MLQDMATKELSHALGYLPNACKAHHEARDEQRVAPLLRAAIACKVCLEPTSSNSESMQEATKAINFNGRSINCFASHGLLLIATAEILDGRLLTEGLRRAGWEAARGILPALRVSREHGLSSIAD